MAKTNIWISVSDLMTGLMLVFLFISIAYMRKEQLMLSEYVDTKQQVHEKLEEAFQKEIADSILAFNNDLSMRFTEAALQYEPGGEDVNDSFGKKLDTVIPRYFAILLADPVIRQNIKEICVEGHTDTTNCPRYGRDSYVSNLVLSQKRALNVVKHIKGMKAYSQFSPEERKLLEHWITATGYSFGRPLDEKGEPIFDTEKPMDLARSRRVEIRVITDDYKVLENLVKSKDGNEE